MSTSENIGQKKEGMRRRLRRRRKKVTSDHRAEASVKVCDFLLRRLPTSKTRHLAGYCALDQEIEIHQFMNHHLEEGTTIYFPRVTGPGTMEFCAVGDLDELQPGAFGIEEPTGPASSVDSIEVFLVPGLAFDRRGQRLGFGKGYYDRALPDVGRVLVVGVGYDWQLVEEVPSESHDRPMDAVVTESGWARWSAQCDGAGE